MSEQAIEQTQQAPAPEQPAAEVDYRKRPRPPWTPERRARTIEAIRAAVERKRKEQGMAKATKRTKRKERPSESKEKKAEYNRRYQERLKAEKAAEESGLTEKQLKAREYQKRHYAKKKAEREAEQASTEGKKATKTNGKNGHALAEWVPGKGSVSVPFVREQFAQARGSHAADSTLLLNRALGLIEAGVTLIASELQQRRR